MGTETGASGIATAVDPDWWSDDAMDARAEFARDVDREAYSIRVREAAREKVAAEKVEAAPGFDAGTLAEVLARPTEPPHRVEGLIPSAASTLLVAQRKTGKTTLLLNLARCLTTGEDFLGRFPVRPLSGAVAVLNYEVSAALLAGWAREADVAADRLLLVNLRGRRNPLRFPEDRERLAGLLRSHAVEALLVDPFGRAFSGRSQNDAAEVGAWLVDLDTFARSEVGVEDLVLSAHAGWEGERTRGSSALEDWPDVVLTMTRDREEPTTRYLSAEGRDVLVEEDQLHFDHRTRRLSLAGTGNRKTTAKVRQVEALMPSVADLLREHPAMSGNQLDVALKALITSGDLEAKHSKGDGARAAQLLERRSLVSSKAGPRGARLFSLTSPTSPNLPEGAQTDLPTSPYREVGQGAEVLHFPDTAGGE